MSDLYQLHTTWTGVAGAPYYSTLTFDPVLGATIQECADAWGDYLDGWGTTLANGMTARVENEVTIIESSNGQLVGAATITGSTRTFTNTGDPLPWQTQLILTWSTNAIVNGRRRRGRTFMPGFTETSNVSDGRPSSVLISNNNANLGIFVAACDGSLVVYSRTHGSFSPVTGGKTNTDWSYLRSRRD